MTGPVRFTSVGMQIVMGVTDQPAPARGQPKRAARLLPSTAQWGLGYGIKNTAGRPSDDEVICVVQVALDGGICDVDTHRALRAEQGHGDAQSRLAPWASRFLITTKVFGGTEVPVDDQLC